MDDLYIISYYVRLKIYQIPTLHKKLKNITALLREDVCDQGHV